MVSLSKLETLMVVIGGSVEDFVEEAGQLHEGLALNIFSKMSSAVEFMHSLRFVHRDIKGQLLHR